MENHKENIRSLLLEIKEKIGKPVSNRVVIASIESLGIREKDMEVDFGVPCISTLANLIFFELINAEEHKNAKNSKETEVQTKSPKLVRISDYLWIKTSLFIHYYPLGIFHLLPVFIQLLAIVFFGYSLWTFSGFNHVQSTAVVLGIIIGLIATGGFVQVIGRQASFYWNHDDFFMTKKTIDYLFKMGILSLLLLSMLFFIGALFIPIFPFKVLIIIFVYAFMIGSLLLILAPLHTIRQRWVISLAVFSGTLLALLLKTQTDLFIYATHWIGIGLAFIISKLYIYFFFMKLLKGKKANGNPLFNSSVVLYHNYKYFFYGLFLYLFIFTDRLLAWSSTINGQLPFLIFFEKNYELGMDTAIIVFLLLSGVLEFGIASFSKFLDIGQKNTLYNSPKEFNNQILKIYIQHVLLLFLSALTIFILIYFIINSSWGYSSYFHEELDPMSINISIIGGIGYFFLAWGMLNTLYLFTLGQAAKPLQAIIVACLFNWTIGLFFSRFVAYEYSVIGMLLGSIIFMLLTLKANIKFINNLDYYYYAAY
jgi:hypothetical protein